MTAVVIAISDAGVRSYRALVPGVISTADMKRADQANDRIGQAIDKFVAKSKLKDKVQNRVEQYWSLGNELRSLFKELGAGDVAERNLFFINVRLHMDRHGDLFPKDDTKRKRIIPAQYFKLAGYPMEIATRISWSQWSYLFDNVYIMESTGFDIWFRSVLEANRYSFNEGFTRLWAESFNATFRNVDLSAWSDDEFVKSLRCTLDVTQNLVVRGIPINSRDTRRMVRLALNEALPASRTEFIRMLMGQVPEADYVLMVTNKVTDRLKALNLPFAAQA